VAEAVNDTESVADMVARGAALLDRIDPGWWREDAPEYRDRDAQPIDLDRLDIGDSCLCIFGFRWGHYGNAQVDALPVDTDVMAHGFDMDTPAEAAALTAEWRRVIAARRAEAVTHA
jgi:hypothetical protein